MNRNVHIIGAGGHAKIAIAILKLSGQNVTAVYDDDRAKRGTILSGVPVIGPVPGPEAWPKDTLGFLAIGGNATRQKLAQQFSGIQWTSAIHPSAIIDPSASIEEGIMVCAGAIIQCDTRIGNHVIVNTGAVIEHDCVLEDFVHVAPRCCLTGNVTVGQGGFLGAGTTVIPGKRIGAWAVAGAGTVVITDIPPGTTMVGNPARQIGK